MQDVAISSQFPIWLDSICASCFVLQKDHLRRFNVTWELHNKHLYHSIVYTEPAIQDCLETLCEQLRWVHLCDLRTVETGLCLFCCCCRWWCINRASWNLVWCCQRICVKVRYSVVSLTTLWLKMILIHHYDTTLWLCEYYWRWFWFTVMTLTTLLLTMILIHRYDTYHSMAEDDFYSLLWHLPLYYWRWFWFTVMTLLSFWRWFWVTVMALTTLWLKMILIHRYDSTLLLKTILINCFDTYHFMTEDDFWFTVMTLATLGLKMILIHSLLWHLPLYDWRWFWKREAEWPEKAEMRQSSCQ